MSMVGRTFLDTSKPSSSILGSITSSVKDDINGAIIDIVHYLNLHDFYSVHLLDYCEGYYTPTAVVNSTSRPSRNVTSCSNRTALFHFDPTGTLQKELKPGVSLQDLHWPSAIQDGIRTLEVASKVMVILYYVGIAVIGLAIIGSIIGFIVGGTLNATLNILLSIVCYFQSGGRREHSANSLQVAFLALGIASAIATVISVKATNIINQQGNRIGVAAYRGNKFLAMTWTTTALMLVAAVAWIAECCSGRRKLATYMKEGKVGRL